MVTRAFLSLLVAFILALSSASAKGQPPLEIPFGELTDLAARQSPEIRMMEESYGLAVTERDVDLQWTNPDISYFHEYAGGARDQYLVLSKEFEMPWIYSMRKNGWNSYVEGAQLEKEAKIRDLHLTIKGQYVEFKLLETQLSNLQEVIGMARRISEVAQRKKQEGTLSGLEEQTIRMAVFNLQADVVRLEDHKDEAGSGLKALLGIEPSRRIHLVTDIVFLPVEVDGDEFIRTRIPETPGSLSRQRKIASLEKRTKMELARILPAMTVEAGYKRVSPDENGYVAGVTLPFPVLDWNRAQRDQQKQELGLLKAEHRRSQISTLHLVSRALGDIDVYREALQSMAGMLGSKPAFLNSLSVAFQEGQISIWDVLNAVQVHMENKRNYSEFLTEYYHLLFLLESISGEEIVSFDKSGDDR